MNTQTYLEARKKAKVEYAGLICAYCPALNNDPVYFTSEGFNHLIYNGARRERNKKEQVARFKLVPYVKRMIEKIENFDHTENRTIQVRRKKKGGKTVKEFANAKYWVSKGKVKGQSLKVVIIQVEKGNKRLASIVPAWKKRHKKSSTKSSHCG